MDAMAIQYNADVQAQNIRTNGKIQSAQYQAQAAGERAAGKIAYSSGLLSAGTQFANNFMSFGQTSMGRTAGTGLNSNAASSTPFSFQMPTFNEWYMNRNRGGFAW